MEWREVVDQPSLKDLPFKIETNEWRKIVMTPAAYTRGVYQGRIITWFTRLGEGDRVFPECPVQTSRGLKVAEVFRASDEFFKKHGVRNPLAPQSAEIAVGVVSPSNNPAGMEEKRWLYFQAGAKEFWLCDEQGDMHFFNPGKR